ncbi:alpha/beta fold hydrolase [uncultured Roseobacter sp.]|uniref:alpha/beta hydrolase family protein n=1 Tax=uncultured Roseobacter sp. TaxID=114847 RepID=UPI0026120529|nr:alpha/beta fold hydrolase [uncultured Roseobacter sp.]
MKRLMLWLGALCVALAGTGLVVLDRFSLPGPARVSELVFEVAGQPVAGTLVLPPEAASAVVLLVHGDGPQDRWSDGGYFPLVQALLAAGIGVFSWDKPGVGQSGGDWLAQSMQTRADEAAAALRFLRDREGIAAGRLGFLGFSQAGWVVPQAAMTADAAFVVLVGPAVNWRRQGAYFTRRQLERAGLGPEDVAEAVARNLAENDALFGAQGTSCTDRPDLSAARCGFVRRNYGADAGAASLAMTMPVLVMVGAEDLNVDPGETAEVLGRNPRHDVRIIPAATHSLLRARHYNHQTPQDWPLSAQLRFLLAGQRAYAPGVLDQITGWILQQP